MLSPNSSLRRVPSVLDPKQAVFIDGIRHSIDIIDLAYSRMRNTLSEIALVPPSSDDLPKITPYVFLDAWAMVDAIHKFEKLYSSFPGMTRKQPEAGEKTFSELCESIIKIRNIADHPTANAERIASGDHAVFGTLNWMTGFNVNPIEVYYCTLRPGTLKAQPSVKWPKILTTLDWPTDYICLSAGGINANLSTILPHIEKRVKHFEIQLDQEFSKDQYKQGLIINDAFTRQVYRPEKK